MSQKKVYLYSPDGQAEGWYMEDDAPAGWLPSPPASDYPESDYQGSVQPGTPSDEQQAKDDQDSIDPELEDLKQKVAEAEAE